MNFTCFWYTKISAVKGSGQMPSFEADSRTSSAPNEIFDPSEYVSVGKVRRKHGRTRDFRRLQNIHQAHHFAVAQLSDVRANEVANRGVDRVLADPRVGREQMHQARKRDRVGDGSRRGLRAREFRKSIVRARVTGEGEECARGAVS